MSPKRRISAVCVSLGLLGLGGCGQDGMDAADGPGVAVTRAALVATTSSEYKLEAVVDPEILEDRVTELWARVYRPATLVSGTRYPVVVFLHGNHATCGTGENPRIDDNIQYTTTGTCPPNYVVVPNHEGYAYVADELAAQGYIVVSINANRGINAGSGIVGDSGLNLARGRLVLKHLALLSEWDRGVSEPPASLGVSLFEQLDFNQLGLMGHSRGGEGMRAARQQYLDPDSPWPQRIVTPLGFRGMFEIGPVDGQTARVLDVQDLRWSVLLPMCDADVSNLAGIRPFDRSMAFLEEEPPSFKASLTVWGANHNYYNSEWQVSDSSGCLDHTPLFESGPGITGSEDQRETGRILMSSFFLGNVGEEIDPLQNSLFDPRNALPPDLTEITRVDRGFTLSPDTRVTLRLEDFVNDAGTSTSGQPTATSGVTVTHGPLPEHDPTLRGGTLTWTSAGPSTFFQTNFTPEGSGISLATYGTLDLRVDRAVDFELNPPEPTDFTVQLVDAQDGLSAPVHIAEFLDLRGPVGGPNLRHRMLQTARIPLSSFAPTHLDSVRGVRLTFDQTASGSIHVANIRATRQACEQTPKLDLKVRQVVRQSNQVQYRFQVFNQDTMPVELSDLSVRLWFSDPTQNLVSQVFYGGHVFDGGGAFQFGNVAMRAQTTAIEPPCTHAPDRIAAWAATVQSVDARSLPAEGGAWVDGQFIVHRADWSPFASLENDFSQTPAYQGGVVSDATWPTVYGDDMHFVLYYRGQPVTEFVAPTALDPQGGAEPSCLTSCVEDLQGAGSSGMAPLATPRGSDASPRAGLTTARAANVWQAQVTALLPTTRPNMAGAFDLEVVSDEAFPIRGEIPTLRGRDVEVTLSRYPDPSDLHRLTFTLSADELAALRDSDSMDVHYGAHTTWSLSGPLSTGRP